MNAARTTPARARQVLVAAVGLVLAAPLLAGPSVAAQSVRPANGGYTWTTVYESGGLREGAVFSVTRKKTVTLSTVRGICSGDYGVMRTYDGKQGRVAVRNGAFKKVERIKAGNDTATLTLSVRWKSARKATGWYRVTGTAFDQRCDGTKVPFALSYYR